MHVPQPYPDVPSGQCWHLTDSKQLLHNAVVGKGFVPSVSLVAASLDNSGFVSPYQFFHQDKAKEALWEETRATHYPQKPSRMGGMFLLLSREDAEQAQRNWTFGSRMLLRAIILPTEGLKLHVGDSKWLNTLKDEWPEAAHRYWSGAMSDAPLREIIVHGQVYFPDWQKPPFESMV